MVSPRNRLGAASMKSALLALVAFFLQATQSQSPGSIDGVVVRVGTSTPVVRARVSVSNAQMLTDESGRFSFRNLQPGSYRISVAHNAYIPGQYGGRRAAEVTVGPGQAVKDIVLGLVPRGATSGRVFDRNGDSVTNATVQALKHVYQDGRRILVPVDSARTNDRGEYRLFWLAPGPYVISAVPQESACAD